MIRVPFHPLARLAAPLALFYFTGAGRIEAQEVLEHLSGIRNCDQFGNSVSGIDDLNGDGVDDLLIGAPQPRYQGFYRGRGYVVVVSGADGTLIDSVNGLTGSDEFGDVVDRASDVDGDGVEDFIVGAVGADDYAGYAKVSSGADRSVLHHWQGTPGYPQDRVGSWVGGAGDLDGDGFDDLLVLGSGNLNLYSGVTGGLIDQWPAAGIERFDGGNDVNADGYADVIVGAPGADQSRGLARVFSGENGFILHSWSGETAGDLFGDAVDGAGDVNADGFDDLIVGEPLAYEIYPNAGRAHVFSGATGASLYSWHGNSEDAFGGTVSGAGDVNNDGFDDVVIASCFEMAPDNGRIVVFSGLDGDDLHRWHGTRPYSWLGHSLDAAGDVDGDGYDDVILGSKYDSNGDPGYAVVFSGFDGATLYTWPGHTTPNGFGFSVSGAGDVNGDGIPDLLVGAGEDDLNGANSGAARVYSGADGSLLYSFNGGAAGDIFGFSASGAGDVNGDGLADVVLGAPQTDPDGSRSGMARVFTGSTVPLTLAEPLPGTVGVPNTLAVTGAQPGGTVVFTGLIQPGITAVPCTSGAAEVYIKNAKHLGTVSADGGGSATLVGTPGPLLSGRTVRLQAVEFETCRFTNLVIFTFL